LGAALLFGSFTLISARNANRFLSGTPGGLDQIKVRAWLPADVSESHEQKKRKRMHSTRKTARIAGLLYLVNGVTGFFSIIYVPGKLMVSENAAATANNILASERLFRLGMVSELICAAEFVFLLCVLYRLLGAVNKKHASLMVILGLLQIPIMFVNVLNEIAALSLLRGVDFLSVFDQPQRQALAMQFLNLHGEGFVVVGIFWGLWLFPFGILVFKSGFLPRILGVLLIAACFGYLADSLTSLLLPSYENLVGRIANIPLTLGGTHDNLVAFDQGSKGSTIGSRSIK
jgi:Domain of unknown function (DUF4386)